MKSTQTYLEILHKSKVLSAFPGVMEAKESPWIFSPHKVKQRRGCMGFCEIICNLQP